jgi:hypothetical protein
MEKIMGIIKCLSTKTTTTTSGTAADSGEEKSARMTIELTYEVKKGIVDEALVALHQGKKIKTIAESFGIGERRLKHFITNKKQIDKTVSFSKTGGAVIRRKSKTKSYKFGRLRTLVLKKLSALPLHSSLQTQRIFAKTVALQGKDWLLANPKEVLDKSELQRLPSFVASRTWTEGVLKQFQHLLQPVLTKPPRRPKGTDPLFYIEGSEVKRINFSDYMDMNQIIKVVPNAVMAFYRNTNVHDAAPKLCGHVTIQEIGGRLRLGIIADNRDRNRTLLLLWKGDLKAMFMPLENSKWNEIGDMWETARMQCNSGGWLVSKVFGQQTTVFVERSQGTVDAQCAASPSGPDFAKLPAWEEIFRLELDILVYNVIYISDNGQRKHQPDDENKNVYSVPVGEGVPLVLHGRMYV